MVNIFSKHLCAIPILWSNNLEEYCEMWTSYGKPTGQHCRSLRVPSCPTVDILQRSSGNTTGSYSYPPMMDLSGSGVRPSSFHEFMALKLGLILHFFMIHQKKYLFAQFLFPPTAHRLGNSLRFGALSSAKKTVSPDFDSLWWICTTFTQTTSLRIWGIWGFPIHGGTPVVTMG